MTVPPVPPLVLALPDRQLQLLRNNAYRHLQLPVLTVNAYGRFATVTAGAVYITV